MREQAGVSSSMHARACGMRMQATAASPQSTAQASRQQAASMLMRCKHAGSAALKRARPEAGKEEHSGKHLSKDGGDIW